MALRTGFGLNETTDPTSSFSADTPLSAVALPCPFSANVHSFAVESSFDLALALRSAGQRSRRDARRL
jgi:hypothetical protein